MIYRGQSRLLVELDTKIDLTDMASAVIRYRKPDATEGFWTAARVGTTGKVSHDITISEAPDVVGVWSLWAEVTFVDGRVGIGDPYKVQVDVPGGTVR